MNKNDEGALTNLSYQSNNLVGNYNVVLYSENIIDSQYIFNSHDVTTSNIVKNSSQIINSIEVFKSSYITNSTQILNCHMAKDSTNIVSSKNVISSNYIFQSEIVTDSWALRNCSNMQNCFFCADCHNLTNCLFCYGLSDAENCIFNKPVAKAQIDLLIDFFTAFNVKLNFADFDNIELTIPVPTPIIHYDYRIHYRALYKNQSFIDWMKNLPNFDDDFVYQITFLHT